MHAKQDVHRALPLVIAVAALLVPRLARGEPPLRISIRDAMVIAERVSHPLDLERANTERASAEVVAARSGYLPRIDLSGSYVRTLASEYDALFQAPDPAAAPTDVFSDLPFGREHAWRAGVDLTWSLWDGGRTRSNVRIAKTALELARLELHSRRALIVLAVTEAYYATTLAARAVEIAEDSLVLAERTLAQAKLGFEQGTTAEFDFVRAEVTRDNTRAALVRVRGDLALAANTLRQLLGVSLDRPIVLTTRLVTDAETEDPGRIAREVAGVRAPSSERAARAPIVQARIGIEASRARTRLARSAWWPQLTAFGNLGVVQYPEGLLPDDDWRRNFTLGASVSFPLFTGFRRGAQIRAARAEERAAEARLLEVDELAEVDQERTRIEASVAAATVTETRRSAELARRAYEIAEVRYAEGISTYLELADARISLNRAQLNLATATRDLQVAQVRIALLPALPLSTETAAGSLTRVGTATALGRAAGATAIETGTMETPTTPGTTLGTSPPGTPGGRPGPTIVVP